MSPSSFIAPSPKNEMFLSFKSNVGVGSGRQIDEARGVNFNKINI